MPPAFVLSQDQTLRDHFMIFLFFPLLQKALLYDTDKTAPREKLWNKKFSFANESLHYIHLYWEQQNSAEA